MEEEDRTHCVEDQERLPHVLLAPLLNGRRKRGREGGKEGRREEGRKGGREEERKEERKEM